MGRSELISDELFAQMQGIFATLEKNVKLIAVLDLQNEKCLEMKHFLEDVAETSSLLELEILEAGKNSKIEEELHAQHLPVVGIYGEDRVYSGACFHGVPGGREMSSFVTAICGFGAPQKPLDKYLKKSIDSINKEIRIQIFVSLACHHCPHVVAACQKIAFHNEWVKADMYDANLYPDLVEKHKIERVPVMVINEEHKYYGKKSIEEIANILNLSKI